MEPNHNKSINEITNTWNQIIINLLTYTEPNIINQIHTEPNHNKSINILTNTRNQIIINLLTK